MRSVFILLVAVVMTACQSSRKELKVLQFNDLARRDLSGEWLLGDSGQYR